MNVSPFTPGGTVSLAVTATTGSVALSAAGSSVEVQNTGLTICFVKLGASAVTAAVTDYPVPAGQSKVIGRNPNTDTYIAAITSSGTTTLYATTGEGV